MICNSLLFDFQQVSFGREELDPHLQESIATTKEWKKLKLNKEREAGLVTDEEAFQFFVGSLDDGKDKGEDKVAEEYGENPDVLIDIEESDLIYNVKPAYVSSKERQMIDDEYYHYPSVIPGTLLCSLGSGICNCLSESWYKNYEFFITIFTRKSSLFYFFFFYFQVSL